MISVCGLWNNEIFLYIFSFHVIGLVLIVCIHIVCGHIKSTIPLELYLHVCQCKGLLFLCTKKTLIRTRAKIRHLDVVDVMGGLAIWGHSLLQTD